MNPTHQVPDFGPVARVQPRSGEQQDDLSVSVKDLINRINFLHFQGHGIPCRFEHTQSRETIILSLQPAVTLGRSLVLFWPDRPGINITDYRLRCVSLLV